MYLGYYKNLLDKKQYREEIDENLYERMKSDGVVMITGASDDRIEFHGAITDEVGVYLDSGQSKIIKIDKQKRKILRNECENENCPYYNEDDFETISIKATWDYDGYAFYIECMDASFQIFEIMDGDEKYCRGIVVVV